MPFTPIVAFPCNALCPSAGPFQGQVTVWTCHVGSIRRIRQELSCLQDVRASPESVNETFDETRKQQGGVT